MSHLSFDESLVTMLNQPKDYEDTEQILAHKLVEQGYVCSSYPKAIAQREESYPTALDAGGLNVAMPHCDPEHVLTNALCLGILKHPISWRRMDAPDQTCDVSLVIMLALTEAHAHLEMLQKIVSLIQDQELIHKIVACSSVTDAYTLISPHLI